MRYTTASDKVKLKSEQYLLNLSRVSQKSDRHLIKPKKLASFYQREEIVKNKIDTSFRGMNRLNKLPGSKKTTIEDPEGDTFFSTQPKNNRKRISYMK